MSDQQQEDVVVVRPRFGGRPSKHKQPMQTFSDVGGILIALGTIGSVLAGYLFNRENGQQVPDWPSVIAVASLSGFLVIVGLLIVIGGYLVRKPA